MTTPTLRTPTFLLTLIAGTAFAVAGPIEAGVYNDPQIKQVKVKNHKVKVKTYGGKAKIKTKANGKEKVKVKGINGQYAAAIAADARRNGHGNCSPQPYYGK